MADEAVDDDEACGDNQTEDGETSRDITEEAAHESLDEGGENNLLQTTLTARHAFPSGSLLVCHRISDPSQHGQRYNRRARVKYRR